MNKQNMLASFIILISSLFLCTAAFGEMPKSDPEALWDYISKTSPYQEWGFWPDHQGMQSGRAPHGPLHKVFVNDKGLDSEKPPVKYGTIAVKENYGKDKELKAITVMYKSHGFNPDAGDWYWAKYSPDGKADKFGKPAGCVGCHGTRAKNDFILVHEFPPPMPAADAGALWEYISQTSPYQEWGFWPDHQGMQSGRAPHGPLHKVFVNDKGLGSEKPPVQYGTIAVKENYGMDKELKAITVMYKSHGFNPDAGDWYWAKYSPDGKADKFGKPAGCVGCHGTRAKNDFVLVHEFD